MGGSYGGYSTLMGMTYFAGAFDAGVAAVGMSSLVTFLENTAPYRRILRINEYGDPVTERELLLKLPPVTYIDRIKGPMLITQGVTDPRVPAGESIQMLPNHESERIGCGAHRLSRRRTWGCQAFEQGLRNRKHLAVLREAPASFRLNNKVNTIDFEKVCPIERVIAADATVSP